MAGIDRFPATTTRFCTTTPLLGSHLRLGRAGCVIDVPRRLLLVSTGMDLLLISDRLWSRAAEGMGKVLGTKQFQLKFGKLKMLALIKIQRYLVYYGGKVMNQRAATILKHSHTKFKGFLPWRLHE
jgi:hypothetical protein